MSGWRGTCGFAVGGEHIHYGEACNSSWPAQPAENDSQVSKQLGSKPEQKMQRSGRLGCSGVAGGKGGGVGFSHHARLTDIRSARQTGSVLGSRSASLHKNISKQVDWNIASSLLANLDVARCRCGALRPASLRSVLRYLRLCHFDGLKRRALALVRSPPLCQSERERIGRERIPVKVKYSHKGHMPTKGLLG